ncbi:MAG: TlpA family protein disulfide reductase [Chlorobi bacterium]|nr:TlpA family protein disulfide reductase [Chlorobiota bacterium]
MKKSILPIIGLLFLSFVTFSPLPEAEIKDLQGRTHRFSEVIANGDRPVIVSFWATWCVPCIKELDAIAEVYPDWREETGVKLVAVSVDDEKTARRIKPMVHGRGWTDFEIYHDYKGELQQALHIVSVPYLIVIHKGKIVFQKNTYTPGSEEELYDFILSLK